MQATRHLLFTIPIFLMLATVGAEAQADILFEDDFSTDPRTNGKWTMAGITGTAAKYVPGDHFILASRDGGCAGAYMFADVDVDTRHWAASFRFRVDDPYLGGADGLVFMFYKYTDYQPGLGGHLGFEPTGGGYAPGYGIEFDNFFNPEFLDVYPQHIALIGHNVRNHITDVPDSRVEDGRWHDVKVIYEHPGPPDPELPKVSVYVDGAFVLDWILNDHPDLPGGFGFSSGVCSAKANHRIDDFVLEDLSCPTWDDPDFDGVCSAHDNCPATSNPGQTDIDHDGIGDACDDWHDLCGDVNSVEVPLHASYPHGARDDDEGISDWIDAGFPFFLYDGFSAHSFRVFADGLSVHRYFDDPGDTSSNAPLPYAGDDLGHVIAPFWADLEDVTVCMVQEPDRLSLQWTGHTAGTGAPVEFQSSFDSSGVITYAYGPDHDPAASNIASIGIEGYDSADGMCLGFHDLGAADPGTGHALTPDNPWLPSSYLHTVF